MKLSSIIRLKTGNNHEWENQLGIITDTWTVTKNKVKKTTYRVAVESSAEELHRATTFEVTGDKLEVVKGVKYTDLSPYVLHRYAIDRGHAKRLKYEKQLSKINKELFEDYLFKLQRHKQFKVTEENLPGEWSVAVYRVTYGDDSIDVRRTPILDEGCRLADFYNHYVHGTERYELHDKYIGRLLKLMNATGRLHNDEKASVVLRYLRKEVKRENNIKAESVKGYSN